MQITTVKQLNAHTNKRITSYEFERMMGVEKLYLKVVFILLLAPVLVMAFAIFGMKPPKEKETPLKEKYPSSPIAEPIGDLEQTHIKSLPTYSEHWGLERR